MLKVLNYVNICKMQENRDCACVCIYCAWGVPSVCLGDAWWGIRWEKFVKTHTLWSKHVYQAQSRVNPGIGTHLSPTNSKMPLEHFDKHMACNTTLHIWAMHEHMEICLNNTDSIKSNGTKPNQNFEKKFAKNHSSQPLFRKSPIQEP